MNFNKTAFRNGFKDAFPVFISYFAVAIAIGLNAVDAGLTPFQATLMSLTNLTSAGQATAISIIAEHGTLYEILISQIVINIRYLLMGAALSIKLDRKTNTATRLLLSYGITDEVFGLSSTQKGVLCPWYTIGCWVMALPGWVLGTFLGSVMGNVLPQLIINALSLSLYAMFIAIILPTAKHDLTIGILIFVSMLSSFAMYKLMPSVSSGNRVIILTVLVSCIFAMAKPVKEEDNEQ